MTAEYGSGRYVPIFTSGDVAVLTTGGAFLIAQTRTFWLYLMNEAGVSLPSPAVTVTAPIGGRISVSFPETNRDTATGYKYCFIVASLTTTLADAWIVGLWRLFQTDSDAFATTAPIVFSRDEHLVVPPAAVSLPAGLPTGASLVPGMVRLISGGIASGASYYIYYPWLITDPNSPYFRHSIDGDKVIERSPGEYWVRFGNPNFGLFPIGGNIFGDTGACRPLVAVDEEFLAQNLLFGVNYAAADNTDSVTASAKGLTVFFGSDTGDDILAGSRFGLNIQVDGFPATTLLDRRIVVRFLGFYNPVTGVLDTTSGLSDGASMAGIGVDMTQTNAETGFLAISKTLPGIQKAVFKIFPRFRASEIYPPLVQGSVVSIVPILLPQGGTRVPLASIFETSVGGFVAPIADFGRVVPGDGTLNVLPGLFVVRGHESALQPKQTIAQITPNTLNQQLAVTQDGRAVVRGVAGVTALSGGEALLALFDFGTGESVASGWSNNIVLSAAGGISITATYPVSGAFGMVRSGIPEIAGNIQAYFNPPQVRIYIKLGSTIYRLNSPQPVVIGTTQVFSVTSLTNTTVVGATTAPPFTDFCLFDPPTVSGAAIGGSLPIATYQVAIAYSFLSGTQCTRIRQATADGCIPAYRRSLFESNSSPIIQAIELLSTAGLIERTAGGSAAIIALSSFARSLLGSATDVTARTALNLGDVNNTSDANKPVSTAQQAALNLKANTSALSLKADLVGGFIPSSQLPGFVDDVLEFAALVNFPAIGETGKIYVAIGTNITYRWSGSAYIEISASLALGTTSATAYRGDFGNTAYLHSQVTGNPHNTVINLTTNVTGSLPAANGGVTTIAQTFTGAKTFSEIVRAGVGVGNVRLTPGSTANAGYLEVYRGDTTTRLGYIGADNVNLNYQTEGTAVHSFNGNRVDILGGIVPPTTSSRISFFVNGGNAYSTLICGTAAVNYKAYDICNESGNFSIRRILDGYTGIAGTLLTHTNANALTLGDTATKSNATYGSITINGQNNAYAGIHFPSSADGSIFMLGTASRHNGVWSPTNSWQWLYNIGNLAIYSGGVASEGGYIGLFKGLGSLPGYPSNRFPTVSTDFGNLYFSVAGAYSAHINVSGVYTAVSDKNKKTVVEKINEKQTLEKISRLPVNRYFFNAEDKRITRIGTFAQDFYREFECGGNQEIIDDDSPTSPDKMLAVSDVAGICLAGIKGLMAEIAALKAEIVEVKSNQAAI